MRFVVLGAGLQGSACAYDLLRNPAVERVVVADIALDDLPPFLEARRADDRLVPTPTDARDEAAVLRLLEDADGCVNALPYYFNEAMARLAIRAGTHYADLGGNTGIVRRQLEMDDAAQERGVSVIPDCGLAPGMVNILAADGIRRLDETDTVKIRVGGLPQHPEPPLNYHIVYSLEGVLDYYTTPSWILREGRVQQVDALSEVRTVEFPEPVGTLEAFHTGGGLSLLPWKYEGRIRSMEYKTLRYPGHAAVMRAVRDLGLLDTEPIDVDGVAVAPRRAFIASVEPRLRRPEAPDLVAMRVDVRGTRSGAPHALRYELLDYRDAETGMTAMERTTGFSLAIIGLMQMDGRISRTGVFTPDESVPADAYLDELRARGVRVETSRR